MGEPLLHGSDLGGELRVGETLGLELQQVGEDADAEVDELDREEDEEGGEVSYLENFIKIHRHRPSIPSISFMRTIILTLLTQNNKHWSPGSLLTLNFPV